MTSGLLARRLPVIAGGAAIIAMVGFTAACGSQGSESPSSTTTTTTTTAPSPTEKGLDPNGGNKFTPTVKAPPPATAVPGDN